MNTFVDLTVDKAIASVKSDRALSPTLSPKRFVVMSWNLAYMSNAKSLNR